ncbi:MAG: helix-turn-helix domain-containing protein [Patescibacteria group bacterium]|nr:helix-turn-helix domain-containing protein [Patescibacteria group bacterium]
MLKVKLQEIARKLAKNSSEIARETGINRNTINALMHNKVDGLKFPTIDKLCQTYGLNLTDLLEYQPEEIVPDQTSQKYFRQEAPYVPFFAWPWVTSLGLFMAGLFDYQYKQAFLYFKDKYAFVYQNFEDSNQMASHFYRKYSEPKNVDRFMVAFESAAQEGEHLYQDIDIKVLLGLSKQDLIESYNKYRQTANKLWRISYFHDAFDVGFERETLKKIAQDKKLTDEEIITLSSIDELTFHDKRRLALLELARSFKTRKNRNLEEFLVQDAFAKEFMRTYSYYKNTGAGQQAISTKEIAEEMDKYVKDKAFLESEYQKLVNYKKNRQEKITNILKKHRLSSNPLYFFGRMAYLRERRKQVVLMLISVGDALLSAIEVQTGIAKKYLYFLSHEEVEGVLKGLVSQETLKERMENPLLIESKVQEYRLIVGPEADSIKQELEGRLSENEGAFIVPGIMASQGYGKGLARIIKTKADFAKFKPGEVIVASSIGSEFDQYIRQAAAIVIEDENPLNHAAQAAREWGRPCIIAAKDATRRIEDGDSVEVRANHRTIKVIKK